MRRCTVSSSRKGALTLEAAFVYPVMLFLLLALIAGGVAVLRHQQVACLAREAARWAAVRGGDYERYTDAVSPKEQEIVDKAVAPLLNGMAREKLTVRVEWIDRATGAVRPWDSASKEVKSISALGEYVTNSVRVTVTYSWSPRLWFVGTLQLRSEAESPLAF